MRYVAVIHEYWINGGTFDQIELDVDTLEQARDKAAAICHRKTSTFNNADYTIVEISDQERLIKRGWTGKLYIEEIKNERKALPS